MDEKEKEQIENEGSHKEREGVSLVTRDLIGRCGER
jgi:hypothetical protein